MSPLPKQFINRWRDGYGAAAPAAGTLYWHILLGDNAQLRETARTVQQRLSKFPGLHMTPLRWLHLTVLTAGPANQISDQAMNEMLAVARASISGTVPITIELSRVIYHPEAIVLAAQPAEALTPIREAARQATLTVTGHDGIAERSSPIWTPHVTLCYSTSAQPAEPIIAALGKMVPGCHVTIDAFNLVIQYGAEWLWNWSPVGTVSMSRPLPAYAVKAGRSQNSVPIPLVGSRDPNQAYIRGVIPCDGSQGGCDCDNPDGRPAAASGVALVFGEETWLAC
jgi:2'-5' RNA ligase